MPIQEKTLILKEADAKKSDFSFGFIASDSLKGSVDKTLFVLNQNISISISLARFIMIIILHNITASYYYVYFTLITNRLLL